MKQANHFQVTGLSSAGFLIDIRSLLKTSMNDIAEVANRRFVSAKWPVSTRDCSSTKKELPTLSRMVKMQLSVTGNRTPVSRVTGGDTYHYTITDLLGALAIENVGLK